MKYSKYYIVAAVSWSIFVFVWGGLITKFDIWIHTNITLLWSPLLNQIMLFITNLGGAISLTIFSTILFIVLILKKKWHHSLLLALSMIGGLLFESGIKLLIQRPRPPNALIEASGYSFPSGHATMSIIFFLIVAYLFKDEIKSRAKRNVFIASGLLLVILIGISRVYLNVHWFSDVVAGFALGTFWATLLILIFTVVAPIQKTSK